MAKRDIKPKKRRRRHRRRGALYVPMAVLLTCLAIIIGLSAFFRISDINVSGHGIYSAEDIIIASGIEIGDNLFFVDDSKAAINIHDELTYVDEVKITRKLPNTISIEITESYPLASIGLDGEYWIIDKNGKLLEKTDASGIQNTISVKGIIPVEPVPGRKVAVAETSGTQLKYLTNILDAIMSAGIQNKITWIDVSNIANISFDYDGRFTVKLGSGENIEYKFQLLFKVEAQLDDSDRGTIDLSTDKEATFSSN